MDSTFTYIKNKIGEYRKEDILEMCYNLLDKGKDRFDIWEILLLMRWTYSYGEEKSPPKQFNTSDFSELLALIRKLNESHVSYFIKTNQVDRAFLILHSQQFYLQKQVNFHSLVTQLKFFSGIKVKYDIGTDFEKKTGLTIPEFLTTITLIYSHINTKLIDENYNGYLDAGLLKELSLLIGVKKLASFLSLMVLNYIDPIEDIKNFKGIKREDFQIFGMSFFVMKPFQLRNNQIKFTHPTLLNYCANYFLYDFMKPTDENKLYRKEWGDRLEKYFELGMLEIDYNFLNENQIKSKLSPGSACPDFLLPDQNIYIECKAIELNALPGFNPTDELLYNNLNDNILKAYFKQMLPAACQINPNTENWGIILTYKEFFYGHYKNLFDLGMERFKNVSNTEVLSWQNVFIIDIYTWNKVLQIIKERKASLLEILQKVKLNNSKADTMKQLFDMHLDEYNIDSINLDFLTVTEIQ